MNTVRTMRIVRGVLALLLSLLSFAAFADVFRPAYLELREIGGDQYDVLWKVPAQGDARLAVTVRLPPDARQISKPQGFFNEGSFIERWRIERPGGLTGATLRVEGIAASVTDVIVRIERQDGTSQVERLLPARPEFTVQAASGVGEVASSYFVLGVGHILGGIDHLLFLLALLALAKGIWPIVRIVTGFTLAHSITLSLAALGIVDVPARIVEPLIAATIIWVALENLLAPAQPRWRWLIAALFGLVHGLGFASALTELGLPREAMVRALIGFNVGVELGQLAFVAVVMPAVIWLARPARFPRLPQVLSILVAAMGAVWLVERLLA